MKILVACEVSGRVRDAFLRQGQDAVSCDLLPSWLPGPHLLGDVRAYLKEKWDLMIGFPPCTFLSVSGARWWAQRRAEQEAAIGFFLELWNAPIEKVALENPIGIMSTVFRKPDQIIEPFHFGVPMSKATCLWLRGLPKLAPTHVVRPEASYAHTVVRSARLRSATFPEIAEQMAIQWG